MCAFFSLVIVVFVVVVNVSDFDMDLVCVSECVFAFICGCERILKRSEKKNLANTQMQERKREIFVN